MTTEKAIELQEYLEARELNREWLLWGRGNE
jgi:hypothetical protein